MLADLNDSDTYVINPWFRLRNEYNHIFVNNAQIEKSFRVDPAYGIILALCDGKRTIGEISNLAVPLVKDHSNNNALEEARRQVHKVIDICRRSFTEWEDSAAEHKPSEAALILASYLPKLFPLQPPIYEVEQFYPKNAFPKGNNDLSLRERVPTNINWHLTSECSTDCQYCYLERRKIPRSKLLSADRILELFEEASRIGVLTITPNGGDVILYPQLCSILDTITEYQFSPIRISTKSFVSDRMARQLAQYNLISEIQFSIDSNVADIADYLVQTPGSCERTIQSICNTRDAGLKVAVKAVITPYNICTVPQLYRELKHMGVTTIRMATYSRSGYHHRVGLFNHGKDYDWLDKQLDSLREEFSDDEIYYQNGRPQSNLASKEQREKIWENRSRCSAGRTQMMVCADGKVIPCEQLSEVEDIFVGDLTYQSIEEVWNSKKFDEMAIHFPKKPYKDTVCYDCEDFEKCHSEMGYCIRDTYVAYGTIYEAPPTCPKQNSFVRFI